MLSLSQKAINADDLVETLRRRDYGATDLAEIHVVNAGPADWGVVILAAGVKFFCRDGSEYMDGPRKLGLPVGATAIFRNHRAQACVYQFVIALEVRVGDEDPVTLTFQDGVAPGKCLLAQTLTLARQGVIAEAAILSARRSDRLGLSTAVV